MGYKFERNSIHSSGLMSHPIEFCRARKLRLSVEILFVRMVRLTVRFSNNCQFTFRLWLQEYVDSKDDRVIKHATELRVKTFACIVRPLHCNGISERSSSITQTTYFLFTMNMCCFRKKFPSVNNFLPDIVLCVSCVSPFLKATFSLRLS